MACARCGCGVYQTEDIITLNKIWHKCCFTCYKCKQHLDKCSAKIFQGEVYCESCYNCMVQQLETCICDASQVACSPCKPCRVESTPSCNNCEKVVKTSCGNQNPSFDYCKKYEVCFPAEPKVKCYKPVRSCSCIPDTKACEIKREPICQPNPHCFAFPIPREVAKYYNRNHTMPGRYTSPPNCCRPRCDPRPCIKIRTISPCRPAIPPCQPQCYTNREQCGCPRCCPRLRPCPPRPICCHTPRRCAPVYRRKRSPCRPEPCRPDPCRPDPCRPDSCRPDPSCADPPCRPEPSCSDFPCRRVPSCSDFPCRSRPPCRREPPCRSPSPCRPQSPCRPPSPCRRVPSCSDVACRYGSPCRREPSCSSPSPCRPQSPCRRIPSCSEVPCRPGPPCRREPTCRSPSPCRQPSPCRRVPSCSDVTCRPGPPCRRQLSCRSPSPCRPLSPCRSPSPCRQEPPCRDNSPRCSPCVKFAKNCSQNPACDTPRCANRPPRVDCPPCCVTKMPKYCVCGNPNPCSCKMNEIRDLCTAICIRCGYKVYAAERILVTNGAYHNSCFSCYCCHKLLDLKSVFENCGEIYCRQCYNGFFGIQYYGY